MQIHNIQRKNPNTAARQSGRGGKRGKTAGRGHKGQKARAGHRIRPEIRDQIKKLPKLRGYRFASIQTAPHGVNLAKIEKNFKEGETVSPATLLEKKLVKRQGGKLPLVKILGSGDITKKLNFSEVSLSETAKQKIEKAGGKVE